MNTLEWRQVKREVNSLLGITVINIALAGLFMSLGINLIISPMTQLFSGPTSDVLTQIIDTVSIIVGGLAFGLGLLWVLTAAKMMPGVGSVQKTLRTERTDGDSTQLTSVYVRILSLYRSRQGTIKRMVLFGGVGGFLLMAGGVSQLVSIIIRQGSVLEFAGAVVFTGVGVGYLWMTVRFRTYSSGWDRRLEDSKRAEQSLDKQLAEAL